MYTLDKPAFDIADVFKTCRDAITDTGLVARLDLIQSTIESRAPTYDVYAAAATLHLLPRLAVVGSVTKDELVALYSDHLSATRGAARSIYDAIKGAAPNRLCPLCSIGTVAHLDHHLPKRPYPDHSILPINLVPACHFCNDTKKARYPKTANEQTFHPYYDGHLLQEQWVTAKLDQGPPPVLVFAADAPTTWSTTDRDRVARHFKICGLAITFTTNANTLLTPLKGRLERLHVRGGGDAVREHLIEERDTYAAKPNSWQYVVYQTLGADSWFVNGGFRTIP